MTYGPTYIASGRRANESSTSAGPNSLSRSANRRRVLLVPERRPLGPQLPDDDHGVEREALAEVAADGGPDRSAEPGPHQRAEQRAGGGRDLGGRVPAHPPPQATAIPHYAPPGDVVSPASPGHVTRGVVGGAARYRGSASVN